MLFAREVAQLFVRTTEVFVLGEGDVGAEFTEFGPVVLVDARVGAPAVGEEGVVGADHFAFEVGY